MLFFFLLKLITEGETREREEEREREYIPMQRKQLCVRTGTQISQRLPHLTQ